MLEIKKILIERDGLSPDEADREIAEAKADLLDLIESGQYDAVDEYFLDRFGLEADYLFELI
ncbi:MAG: hypothetical protein ONB24_08945, partial [candidate division KSB1 bacterium]|nr:hypothetical protein [candidate division KSB1 bacterium]